MTTPGAPPTLAPEIIEALACPLDEMLARAEAFANLVDEANQKFNLTAIKGKPTVLSELVLQSLVFLPRLKRHAADFGDAPLHVLDLGSGAGIPGVPLALARPEWKVTCLEATGKKARFIGEAAEALGLKNVAVLNERAETLGHDARHRGRYDVVVARFVGGLRELCELGIPFLRQKGLLVTVRFDGPEVAQEAREAAVASRVVGGDRPVACPAPDGHTLLCATKISPSPHTYPRAAGMPKTRPL